MLTRGVNDRGPDFVRKAWRQVRDFDAFTSDNDPHGEHDFGAIDVDGQKLFWKIDYYNPTMDLGSEDPSDPAQTTRVMTVMLAEEY